MGNEKESPEVLDKLLFPKIFRAFRMSIYYNSLIIGFLAVAVICLAGWVMDFSRTVVVAPGPGGGTTELQVYMTNPNAVESHRENYKGVGEDRGVYSTLWHFAATRFHGALNSLFAFNLPGVAVNIAEYFKAVGWALRHHSVYCVILFVIKLAVISIAGGSLCRIAALQFARGEKPGLTEALRFSTKKFLSFFTAPLAPVGMVIFIGLFVFLLGLIGNIPRAGELIVGIFMPLALLAGALIAVVLIGTAAGFNLMFPAVAYDGSDCFDAISRSFSYVYSKPWRMGFYTAVAMVYGAICYVFIRFFAFLLLWSTRWFLLLGVWVKSSNKEAGKLAAIWAEPSFVNLSASADIAGANWSELCAAFLVQLFLLIIVGLLVSFILSFYFSANTIIYSLMRNRVDNTALEDVYTELDEVKAEPTTGASESEESQPEAETEQKE
ncbi:MAG: hypothetical protein JSW23_02720 [Planctomycetota bacterium]|nr:MAG: hypothetical protein JSW23_02720 [Planctomycetota bacterium]